MGKDVQIKFVWIEFSGYNNGNIMMASISKKRQSKNNELNSVSIKEYFVNADIYRNQLAM